MNSDIRPRLIRVFCRRYPSLLESIIQERVDDTLTDMQLKPLPKEVIAIPEKYYAYAFTILNRTLSHEAKRMMRFVNLENISEKEHLAESINIFDDSDAVECCLSELKSEEREVVIMKYYADYSFEKIAKIIKMSPSTVKKRFYIAMERLKDVITPPAIIVPKANNIFLKYFTF